MADATPSSDGPDDAAMDAILATSRDYTLVVLRHGPTRREPGADAVIREHGRRNLRLRAEGSLVVVLRVGEPHLAGLAVFRTGLDETRALLADDPAVLAGALELEFLEASGFPGDSL